MKTKVMMIMVVVMVNCSIRKRFFEVKPIRNEHGGFRFRNLMVTWSIENPFEVVTTRKEPGGGFRFRNCGGSFGSEDDR